MWILAQTRKVTASLVCLFVLTACNLDDTASELPSLDLGEDESPDPLEPICEPGCHPDATCEAVAENEASCVCDTGFEGDGLSCTPLEQNPCLENNGGCGDPERVQCDASEEGDALIAECTTINPCLDDNGGCGDPEFFLCTSAEVGLAECSQIDFCATDNGGCGDPERYTCLPRSGQLPVCRLHGSCEVPHELPLLEDTFVSRTEDERTFESEPFLVLQGVFSLPFHLDEFDYEASREHHIFLKFDLAAIPQDFPLVHAQLELTYAQAERNRAFGYVQVHGVESDWSAAELSYVDTPRIIHPNIAEWRVDSNEAPLRFLAESPRMTEALATLHSEAHAELALQVESEAFGAAFYASEYHDPQTHPRLTLTLLQCEALPLTADANASVNNRQTDTPLGEGDGLLADRDRAEFYLRFDMSQIPLNARIVDARVELVAIDAVDYGGDASFTLDALTTEVWDESSVTYSTRPAATEVPLASFTLDTSEDRSPTEPVILETPELFHAVLEQFESERSISLRITANDDAATFAGRSHAEPNWRPRLTVIYE